MGEIAVTFLKVVELSTSIFRKSLTRLFQAEFVRRNAESIIICSVLWLGLIGGSFYVCHSLVSRSEESFRQRGALVTTNLAGKIAEGLLEEDILSLNEALGAIRNTKDLLFAAILNHAGKIVAHSDPRMINKSLAPLEDSKRIGETGSVTIESGRLGEQGSAVSFSTDVQFSGIDIGAVHCVMSAAHLYSAQQRYKSIFLAVVLLSFLLLSGILLSLIRASKAKAMKVRQELESMTSLGPYELRKKIAQGGMAELFLSEYLRDDGFRRTVAVKRILPHLADDATFISMFIREARLAALLQHPNIVQVADFGKIQNAYFIAMEYIHGKNLAEVLGKLKEALPLDMALYIALQVSTGLYYSHSRKDDKTGQPLNIVHRDISPQNILISFQGEVKITDFGISKASTEPSLTQAGVIKGKLSYMSPEQVLGEKNIDHRADLYALGIIMHEMLSGRKLYRFRNEIEAITSIPKMPIPSLASLRPEAPAELETIVMKCLEKDRNVRYQNAQQLRDDLSQLRNKLRITYDASDLANFMNKHFGEEEKEPEEKPTAESRQ